MKYIKPLERDLLKAIKNYPPGTRFISCTGNTLTVKGSCPIFIGEDSRISIETEEYNDTGTFNGYGAVVRFGSGKWADIIYKPKFSYEIY